MEKVEGTKEVAMEVVKEEPTITLTFKEADSIISFIGQLPTSVGKNLLALSDYLENKKKVALNPPKEEIKTEE